MEGLTLFLAFVLALSAAQKALAPDRLAAATSRLSGAGAVSSRLLMVLAGSVEGVAAVFLLVPALTAIGALLAAALWGSYAIALLRRNGEVVDCGCDLATRAKPVDAAQVLRPVLLSATAVGVSLLAPQLTAIAAITDIFAAIGLFVLYLGASELMSIPRPAWRKS